MNLTQTQQKAVLTVETPVAVIASAGTGKTRVLTEHFKHLVIDAGIPPHKILAFTFTEKAAGEMRQRILKNKAVSPQNEAHLNVSTVHSFCHRFLQEYGPHVGLDSEFDLLHESDFLIQLSYQTRLWVHQKAKQGDALWTSLIRRFGFNRLVSMIEDLITDPSFYLLKKNTMQASSEEATLTREIQCFLKDLQQQRIAAHRISFDDLEQLSLQILENRNEVKDELSLRFKHILVDEFQDINPLQARLIEHLYKPGTNFLFLVGDPKQSIYRFRHVETSLIANWLKNFTQHGYPVIQLTETFRIPQKISEALNPVFETLFNESNDPSLEYKPIVSMKNQPQGHVKLIPVPYERGTIEATRKHEAKWLAQYLAHLRLSPDDLNETAILFRNSHGMKPLVEALKKNHIPFKITRPQNLLSCGLVRDLTHVLHYLAGKKNKISQAGIMRSVFFNFSESFVEYVMKANLASFHHPFIFDLFVDPNDQTQWQKLSHLIKKWESISHFMTPLALFETIVIGDLVENESELDVLGEQWLLLIDELQSFYPSLNDLSDVLEKMQIERHEIKTLNIPESTGAVSLMTIHAAKGLEFNRVFLPQLYAPEKNESSDYLVSLEHGLSLKKESLKSAKGLKTTLEEPPLFCELKSLEQKAQREELKRLLYVATTRAKEELFLFLGPCSRDNFILSESSSWNEWLNHCLPKEKTDLLSLDNTHFNLEQQSFQWEGLSERIEKSFEPAFIISHEKKEQENKQARYKPVFSVSHLEHFAKCPKAYELKYVYGIESQNMGHHNTSFTPHTSLKTISAQEWGLLVHEIFQFVDFKTLGNLDTVASQALSNHWIADQSGEIANKLKETTHNLLLNDSIKKLLTSHNNVSSELAFMHDFGNFYLRGKIDRMTLIDNVWTIIDFKTESSSQHTSKYDIQMACYALATSKLMGINQLQTALVFTHDNSIHIQAWDENKLICKASLIETMAASITSKNFLTQQKSLFPLTENRENCPLCPYWATNLCGVKTPQKI